MSIAGVDEVGRGPLAGPVLACAVILPTRYQITGLNDSKKLSEKKREQLCHIIKQQARCYAIGVSSVREIDELNILNATLLAMQRAIENLPIVPTRVLVDGNRVPGVKMLAEAIIGGDATVPVISAASIVAKVTRDYLMTILDGRHPAYGFARHKGYPTEDHLLALKQHGVLPLHRRSFGPVRALLEVD